MIITDTQSTPAELLLVLEQTLGHVVHGDNIVHRAQTLPGVAARTVRIDYSDGGAVGRLPLLGSWSVRASWVARQGVLRALRERPADALLVHTFCSALFLEDVMRQVPTVLSTDATPLNFDSLATGYGHQLSSPRTEQVKKAVVRRALRAAAAVTTWSHWAAESVVRDYGVPREKVHVIRPGVRLDRFTARDRAQQGHVPRLLFVGGDFTRKGGHDLLAAVGQLLPEAELDVVTSAEPPHLPPRTRVHVGLSHGSPELFELYQRADVFVLPTRGDAYGLVFAEAMACGLPVVACDVGAVSELVVHGETGLLVPPGSPEHLAAALDRLVTDHALRRSMGQRALAAAHEHHDAERTCTQLLDLLREVAVRRPGPQPVPWSPEGVPARA